MTSRFKVGDRVRIIWPRPEWYGRLGTVHEAPAPRIWVKVDNALSFWGREVTGWQDFDLEPVNGLEEMFEIAFGKEST